MEDSWCEGGRRPSVDIGRDILCSFVKFKLLVADASLKWKHSEQASVHEASVHEVLTSCEDEDDSSTHRKQTVFRKPKTLPVQD